MDISPQIIEKIKRYCAYSERCSWEVRNKLREFKVDKPQIEYILTILTDEGFLNNKRFAEMFVRGKFNVKGWGKHKIAYELRLRHIPQNDIDDALSQIDDQSQQKKLEYWATKWLKTHQETEVDVCKQKLMGFLLSKGFETDEALRWLNRSEIVLSHKTT